jgi:hypothetical protein
MIKGCLSRKQSCLLLPLDKVCEIVMVCHSMMKPHLFTAGHMITVGPYAADVFPELISWDRGRDSRS